MPQSGFSRHLDFGDEVAGGRSQPGKSIPAALRIGAAAAVAADQVGGAQRLAAGDLTSTPSSSCAKSGTSTSRWIGTPSSSDPLGQEPLDLVLGQRQPVGVPGREIADVEQVEREAGAWVVVAVGEEALGDAALIEDLDRARVQAAGPRARRAPGSAGARARRRPPAPAPAPPPASARSGRRRRSRRHGRSRARCGLARRGRAHVTSEAGQRACGDPSARCEARGVHRGRELEASPLRTTYRAGRRDVVGLRSVSSRREANAGGKPEVVFGLA